MILGLPPSFDVVNFDGAGAGTCLVWHLSFDGDITGAEMGANANDLQGCFSLSNPIAVVRDETGGACDDCTADGGILEGGPFTFTEIGDGVPDMIPAGSITLANNSGMNSQWIVTDSQGNILGLPPMPGVVDFDGAGAGTCLIWHLSYDGDISGLEMGMNAGDLDGDCFSLSNSVTVIRENADGCQANSGELFGGPFTFTEIGDGVPDMIPAGSITLANNSGMNSQWIVTDSQGNILGLPPMPGVVDFDGAGTGTCLIWHLSYDGDITGLEVDLNAGDIDGDCFSLSNSISVFRESSTACNAEGGALAITDGSVEISICAGDGTPDPFDVTLSGNVGSNSAWVITDDNLEILALPAAPPFDLEGAGAGVCLVWHLSFEDGLTGATVGANAADLEGCFSLSNAITVNRDGVEGGNISGGPYEFCVSDGDADMIPTGEVTVSGNSGDNSQWIVTSDLGVILGLPGDPSDVDFDGAGEGSCFIWHISYSDGIVGLEMDLNVADLEGCFSLSNSVEVVRLTGANCDGGAGEAIIVINEINANGDIELANIGTASQNVASYWLCNFPAYSTISNLTIVCGGDMMLDPGELLTVSGFTVDAADGEMGLYLINDYTDPNDLIDYVEWGSSGHQRSSVAVQAGIWTTGDFVPAFSAPNSLEYNGTGDSSSDWSEDEATPCTANIIANNDEVSYRIFPNPANEQIMLEFLDVNEDSSDIEIYDAVGNRIESMNHNINEGTTKEISIEDYRSGAYFIRVSNGNSNKVQRFMKITE